MTATIIIIIKAYMVLLAGLLDWFRGSNNRWCPTALRSALYGFCLAAILGSEHLWTWFAFTALWMLGEAPGWGEPVGAIYDLRDMRPDKLEWWQFGALKRNARFAVVVRGLMWGFPPALLGVIDPVYCAALGMTFAFPAAILIDVRYNLITWNWQEGEIFRGLFMGVMAFIWQFFT